MIRKPAWVVSITFILLIIGTSGGVGLASPAGVTTRVSISSDGTEGDNTSGLNGMSISADGRFIAFHSQAENLVAGDTNFSADIFVRDRLTGETTRASVASDGTQGNSWSNFPSISPDGRYVAFQSLANNLVPNDTNNICDGNGDGIFNEECGDVFVHDRLTGETTRASVASDGAQGNADSGDLGVSISSDGRFVAFASEASNLVLGDTNYFCIFKDGSPGANCSDVFVYDRETGEISRVSLASDGTEGNSSSYDPSISADGRYIAFYSSASNLIAGKTVYGGVFVHDRETGQTSIVSVDSSGNPAVTGGGSGIPSDIDISLDGRYVAFSSYANLVSDDTNNVLDVYVHDRQTGETSRVSVASDGTQGNHMSGFYGVSISADGRFVAFYSDADNLTAGDSNINCDEVGNPGNTFNCPDIFIHDRQTGETSMMSVSSDGSQGDGIGSWFPDISGDGRFVTFASDSSNLVADDNNNSWDVFLRDRLGEPPPPPPPPPSNLIVEYFALGDSIASGHGLMDDETPCRRSYTDAYPWKVYDLLRAKYGKVHFPPSQFLACSGAEANPDVNKILEDPHKWLGYQVDDAIAKIKEIPPDRPVLVSISIGMNDTNWTEPGILAQFKKDRAHLTKWIDDVSASVAASLRVELTRLLQYPNVVVVINDYPNPVNKTSHILSIAQSNKITSCVDIWGELECYERTELVINQLNNALVLEAIVPIGQMYPNRVRVAGVHEIFRGHESPKYACGFSAPGTNDTWIQYPGDPDSNSIPWAWIKKYTGFKTGDCFHPNKKGAQALADAVFARAEVLLDIFIGQ